MGSCGDGKMLDRGILPSEIHEKKYCRERDDLLPRNGGVVPPNLPFDDGDEKLARNLEDVHDVDLHSLIDC